MLKHIVGWDFKEGLSEDEKKAGAQKIKAELENLKANIPQIIDITLVCDPCPTSTRDVVLDSSFANEEDLAIYIDNPDHKRAAGLIGDVFTNRVCFDYHI